MSFVLSTEWWTCFDSISLPLASPGALITVAQMKRNTLIICTRFRLFIMCGLLQMRYSTLLFCFWQLTMTIVLFPFILSSSSRNFRIKSGSLQVRWASLNPFSKHHQLYNTIILNALICYSLPLRRQILLWFVWKLKRGSVLENQKPKVVSRNHYFITLFMCYSDGTDSYVRYFRFSSTRIFCLSWFNPWIWNSNHKVDFIR